MKHIFIVHSIITNLVSQLVIRHLRLSPENCITLSFRNTCTFNNQGVTIEAPKIFNSKNANNYFKKNSILKARKNVKEIDSWLESIIGNNCFSVYAPNHSIMAVQILFTHPLCKSIFGIEEGLGSYLDYDETLKLYSTNLNWRQKFHNVLKTSSRLSFSGLIHSNTKSVFCLCDRAFKNAPSKRIVMDRSYLMELAGGIDLLEPVKENSGILVFDGLIEYNLAEGTELDQLSLKLIDRIFNHYKHTECLVKFHPAQSQAERKRLSELIVRNFGISKIRFLNNNISLELLAIKYPKISFYGFVSSVLVYAKLLANADAYSIIKELGSFRKDVPEIFKEYVELIELNN